MKFIGTLIDPDVLNMAAIRVDHNDNIGTFIDPLFIDGYRYRNSKRGEENHGETTN